MAGESTNLNFELKADSSSFNRAAQAAMSKMDELGRQVAKVGGNAAFGFNSATTSVGAFGGGIGLATSAALAFVAASTLMAKGIINAADKIDELSERTGVSVKQLAGLQWAAKLAGIEGDGLSAVLKTLNKNVSEAGAGNKETLSTFSQLGINVKTATGELKTADQVLLDLADVFPRLKSADRVAVALELLGKQGEAMIPSLIQGKAALQGMIEEGQKLNPVTEDLAKLSGDFNDNVDRLAQTMRAGLLPVINSILPMLNNMVQTVTLGAQSMGSLSAAMMSLGTDNPFKNTTEQISGLNEKIKENEAAQQKWGSNEVYKKSLDNELVLLKRKLDYYTKLRDMQLPKADYSNEGGIKAAPTGPAITLKKPVKEKAEESNSSKWDAELNAQKEAHAALNAENHTFFEFSKSTELAFWRAKADIKGIGIKDAQTVQGKITAIVLDIQKQEYEAQLANFAREQAASERNLSLKREFAEKELALITERFGRESKEVIAARAKIDAIERESRDQRRRLAEQDLSHISTMAGLKVDAEQSAADRQLASGQITQLQRLEMQQQFERQRFDIEFAALQQRLELAALDPSSDPAALQQMQDKKLEMIQQFENKKREIQGAVNLALTDPANNVFKQMETSYADAITGMITGTQGLQQAMANVYKNILATFAQEMIAKPIAMMMTRAVRESSIYQMMAGSAITSQTTASGVIATTKGTEATAVGTANAAEAGTGAMAALAAIPVVGPALAAVAGPAMVLSVMALLSKGMGGGGGGTTTSVTRIPSAAGGWDIPRGMNPMTQLHEQEMILPSSIANPLRSAIAGMSGEGGQGQGGGTLEVNINATPMGNNMFMIHRNDLVKAIKSAHRDGAL